ncbi:MAG: ABC transporter permease [Thermaerobacter sp.]|nr:spermidine/putrescine ABC transporter permease PotC [Bacillota bacterium]REJ37765.1 MAG: spermidine/putrescine ABC transporter permease PotC [Bacillota bacterium]
MSAGRRGGWLAAHSLLTLAFLWVPIAILIAFSFNTSRVNVVWQGFTLDWYGELFRDVEVLRATRNTLVVAAASTLLSTILGTMAAFALTRHRFPGRRIMEALLYVPVVLPEIVLGISLLATFRLLSMNLGLLTVILSHVTFCTPFVALVVRARLHGLDPSLERAAMDLGADEWTTFRRVTLPLVLPGIVAGALLALTVSIDDFIITFFTAGPGSTTLPLHVFSMVKFGVSPKINALSTLMLIITLGLAWGSDRIRSRSAGRDGAAEAGPAPYLDLTR